MESRVTSALIHVCTASTGCGRWGVFLTVGGRLYERESALWSLEGQVCFPVQVRDTVRRATRRGKAVNNDTELGNSTARSGT